jgi:hypothetical protein
MWVGYGGSHKEKRNIITHDYLIANYVCPSNKHYPLEFRRFIKEEDCWSGTETFHQDGKQYLGMEDCQLRSGKS